MSQEQPVYLSYLLRLWSMREDGDMVWRASLETALSGQRESFASLDDLFDFLRKQTVISSDGTRARGDEV